MFHIGFKLFIRQYTAEIDFNDDISPLINQNSLFYNQNDLIDDRI